MMNKLRALLVVSAMVASAGCSTLDSSSHFDDVVKTTKERRNYTQITTKSITPQTKAIVGADVVKAQLHYVGIYPHSPQDKVASSTIAGEVTFFKSYDHFETVNIAGRKMALNNDKPIAETCTEHCTVTQWFSFPFTQSDLSSLDSDTVEFTLSSATGKNVVRFSVPKQYFISAEQEAGYLNDSVNRIEKADQSSSVSLVQSETRSLEMVQYWFEQADNKQQERFKDWAFAHRTVVNEPLKTDQQALDMLSYWYAKASLDERKAILTWLLTQ